MVTSEGIHSNPASKGEEVSHKGVYSQSTQTLVELSKRREGVSVDEIPEGIPKRTIWKMASAGRIFTLKSGCRSFKRRYFDTRERADAYYATNPRPTKKPRPKAPLKACMPAIDKPMKQVAGGPARLPGEPDISKAKWTYGKKPPEVMYHSNTHNR
jgi:hypothetical protein